MKTDLTGYPKHDPRPRSLGIFSRIVAVADGFDAATTRRSYQTVPIEPDQVLREMWENPKRGYDPVLVKALINLIGIYPVGTCVILDTFEVGHRGRAQPRRAAAQPAAGAHRGRRRRRPRCRRPGTLVSLTEQDETRRASAARSSRSPTPTATGSRSATTLSESRLAPAWSALRARRPHGADPLPHRRLSRPPRRASARCARPTRSPTSSRSAFRSAIRWPTGRPSSAPPSTRSGRA